MNAPSVTFRPAIRENVNLILGLIGPSGGGKTFSAMRLAAGICGTGRRFAVIDTEAGRAKHYAERFQFDHADLMPPFRPDTYLAAIQAADKAGYPAIVVDSCSHEWSGEGGILDWQEEELERSVKRAMERRQNASEYDLREAFKMSSWIKPKRSHKEMVSRLLQIRAQLILCFRAEEKVKMVEVSENGKKKTVITPIGFQPICEKNLPYELTCSFLLLPDAPGKPKPIKLEGEHRALFPLDQEINEDRGRRLAEWAKGGKQNAAPAGGSGTAASHSLPEQSPPPAAAPSGGVNVADLEDDIPWEDDPPIVAGFKAKLDLANSRDSLIELGGEIKQAAGQLTDGQVNELRAKLNDKLRKYPKTQTGEAK